MELGNMTYKQIDQLEENLSNPIVREGYLFHETIIRLLCQSLRQNRYLADMVQKSATESRMAYNTMNETKKKMKLDKLQGDVDFMLGTITGVKRNKQSRKIKGIQIGTRTDRE